MSFVEVAFAWFLPITLLLWWLTRGYDQARLVVMLIASLVFYAHNRWWTLGIIGAYCVVDWAVGVWLPRSRRPGAVLALGVGLNLAGVAYWKYTPLLVQTLSDTLGWAALEAAPVDGWVVPIGISFYAFSGIAYMVDVHRRVVAPEPSLLRYGLFTVFFPHLVAGPILRAREFLWHLRPGELPDRPTAVWEGGFLIARGFFKKMVLADTIALSIDPFFANVGTPATAGVWSLPYLYLYSLQIYFDFSGYTDIARGLGLWFGFRWPLNFDWPYLATSVQDFWRRWHMTLSRFLRDYLYVPLGGDRRGLPRTCVNLLATMLIAGLWHGAAWSFVLWGGLHGVCLVVVRLWAQSRLRRRLAAARGIVGWAWTAACVILTFNTVAVLWSFFRLTDLGESLACVRAVVAFDTDKMLVGGAADPALATLLLGYGVATLLAVLVTRGAPLEQVPLGLAIRPFRHGAVWGLSVALWCLALLLAPGGDKPPFIYFQF